MASLRDLYEHTPDPRIDKVRGYYDKASRMAEALYRGFLGSIPQPEGGPVYVDDQGNWSGGQLPEQQAYNTLSWLVPTGGIGEAVDFARHGFRPGTVKAITAYHGSPHKFDQFDMSKIGTGEGAQAYGHGLYFADNPKTAEYYSDALSDGASVIQRGRNDYVVQLPSGEVIGDGLLYGGAHKLKEKWDAENKGNLYKTSLEWPDPAREAADPLGPQHFLDWDRPLSEQADVWQKLKDDGYYPFMGGDYGMVYRPNSKGQLEALKATGIPGIRYLDQGSRGAGNGTYNYVVFDDKIPKIVERNGVTLEDLLRR